MTKTEFYRDQLDSLHEAIIIDITSLSQYKHLEFTNTSLMYMPGSDDIHAHDSILYHGVKKSSLIITDEEGNETNIPFKKLGMTQLIVILNQLEKNKFIEVKKEKGGA